MMVTRKPVMTAMVTRRTMMTLLTTQKPTTKCKKTTTSSAAPSRSATSITAVGSDKIPSYDNKLLSQFKVHQVPVVRATAETLRGYATVFPWGGDAAYDEAKVIIVKWPQPGWRPLLPGTGEGGGVTDGLFKLWWTKEGKLRGQNSAVGGDYIVAATPPHSSAKAPTGGSVKRTHAFVRECNYHPDGGQIFYPIKRGDAFVALFSKADDNIGLQDFVAFYCDGTFGLQILPKTWHQPILPLADDTVFRTKQGRVHASVGVDTVDEFGTWLSVPLVPPPASAANNDNGAARLG